MTSPTTAFRALALVFAALFAFWPSLAGVCQAKSSISLDGPILILDSQGLAKLPRGFRSSAETSKKAPQGSTEGLATLCASASGQFSEGELRELLTRLPSGAAMVDLRQESHGFVSSIAVSWYGDRNLANAGKTAAEIAEDEKARLGELGENKNIGIVLLGKGEKDREGPPEGIVVPVKKVFAESELAPFYGLQYFRIPVPDKLLPRDEDVDAFLDLVSRLPAGGWVHFHDNNGRGRATTFLVMYDIYRNAQKSALDDIVKRQTQLGGAELAGETQAGRRAQEYKGRDSFFHRFYEYAKQRHGSPQTTWSQWAAQHPEK
jgi:hypothetical protein